MKIVCELLRAADNSVFRDKDNLIYGKNWNTQLEKAIRRSRSVFLFWSKHSAASDVVKHEYTYALVRRKIIVPILCDETPLPTSIMSHGLNVSQLYRAYEMGKVSLSPDRVDDSIGLKQIALSDSLYLNVADGFAEDALSSFAEQSMLNPDISLALSDDILGLEQWEILLIAAFLTLLAADVSLRISYPFFSLSLGAFVFLILELIRRRI